MIGQSLAGFIFSTQNENGIINITDSLIQDSIAQSSLIMVAYGNIKIHNTTIQGVYAHNNANILTLIQSTALISNSTFTNERNIINYPLEMMNKVTAGIVTISR